MRRRRLALVCALLMVLLPLLTGATAKGRGEGAVRFGLELDGVFVGWLMSAEGGHAVATVVTEKMGADVVARKHIGNVKYEEISITVGAGMSEALYNWVKAAFDGRSERKNGAVIAADYDYKELSRRQFTGAILTEVGMPALDAASKDAAKMTIKFQPEATRRVKGSGQPVKAIDRKQKQWLPANFRLRIDGLDEATARVNKIEAIVVKQKVTENAVPNLVFTVPEMNAEPLYAWHDDFVINGNNGQEKEKGGTLEYLASDGKTVLFTLTFANLGIFKLSPDKMEAGAEGIRRIKAEMYCEDVRFSYTSAAFQ